VMMRDSLSPTAKHASMLVSAGNGLAFQRRTSTGGASSNTSAGSGGAGAYVKMVRSGSTFKAYKSTDGSSWTYVSSTSITMGSTIYVGVAVSSHAATSVATASFSGASVTAGSTSSSGGSTDGGGTTDGSSSPIVSDGSSTTSLRVVHWNLHHGVGTDGKYDINRIANWIVKMKPDVVSLNEVEKYTGWGNEDQPARYESMLESKTGMKWYAVWAQEYGSWSSNGKGNLLLSRFPFTVTARYELSYERTVALGQVVVNGRNITVGTTHLDPDSGSRRVTQTKELKVWLDGFSEARIVAGDMNAQPTSTEMTYLKGYYTDAWQVAKSGGFAYSASDNPNGYTRNSRIDYVFTSKSATTVKLTRVEVVDTRDSNGVMPSDHRPILAVYTVR
jgi:endonuclease/exonuclease/phosphatase family metal-dependent hydrolase